MKLEKATRKKVKLRLNLAAIAGGGKTYSALLLASGMTGGDWSKIALIDTENSSGSLYSHLGEYNVITLNAPFSPDRYIEAIHLCEKSDIEIIIVDSISHLWNSEGGILDINNKMGGTFQSWAKTTPIYQTFVNAVLNSTCHIITTVRRKQDYEMEKKDNGKTEVKKLGLAQVTREGWDYENTLNFNIEQNHMATSDKDRTGLFDGKPPFIITEETGRLIKEWVDLGEAAPKPMSALEAVQALAQCNTIEDLKLLKELLAVSVLNDISFTDAAKERFKHITESTKS